MVDQGRLIPPGKQDEKGRTICSSGVDGGAGMPTAGRMINSTWKFETQGSRHLYTLESCDRSETLPFMESSR